VEGVGTVGLEDGMISPAAGAGGSPEDGELELGVPELVGPGSPDFVLLVEDGGLDDGDGVVGSSVVTGHLSVQLADGSVEGDVSELLVHVVVGSSGLVPQHNAEGLDMVGSSLEDLVDGQDLALSSFCLELATEMVPEFGLGDDLVRSEQPDGVYLGIGLLLSGQFAAEHQVLSDLRIISCVPSFGARGQPDPGRLSRLI
jgi:hypothetical protein